MEKDKLSRKLAVILHADVVDSTALVRQDETLAHQRIQDAFHRFSKNIKNHDGEAREIRGDALIAEFSKASDAVAAAVSFQVTNADHVQELPDQVRPLLRIGIAMGEVVVADDTVTGEGVVLAQRLEQSAEAGGVIMQGAAYETVPKRLPYHYQSLGELELKGFDEPLRAYSVTASTDTSETIPQAKTDSEAPPPELPNKPSIAVLPFINMSGVPDQEFFSDGITEDIITELSRFESLFVVARNSSFIFRDTSLDIRDVSKRLGVRFVLEGSVRIAGDKVRITGQLINGNSGEHVWADRYDGDLSDVFAVQDEITSSIVSTIAGRIEGYDLDRIRSKPTENLTAYESILRGQQLMHNYTDQGYSEAQKHFDYAISLDPTFARAHALKAYIEISMWVRDWNPETLENALESGNAALALDDRESKGHLALGVAHLFLKEHEKAENHLQMAAKLNPNDDLTMLENGRFLLYVGEPLKGAEIVKQAMRQNPYHPNWYWNILGRCFHTAKHYDEAISALERVSKPSLWTRTYLAACYAEIGENEKALAQKETVLSLKPESNVSDFIKALPYKDEKVLNEFLEGYRKAGFPE